VIQLGNGIVAARLTKRPAIEHSLPYSADDDTGRFLIDPASAAAFHPLSRRGPGSGRPVLQPPLPRRRPDHPGARLCDLVDLLKSTKVAGYSSRT
jgi:hypothetical protein